MDNLITSKSSINRLKLLSNRCRIADLAIASEIIRNTSNCLYHQFFININIEIV